MNWLKRFATASIGKKQLLALTGLGLAGFLIAHLAGNLLLLKPGPAFNQYAHALVTNPLIYLAEAGLVAIFLVHLGLAILLTRENAAARGSEPYLVVRSRGGPSRRSFASQTMIYSGSLVAVFLVLHVAMFKYGPAEAQGYVAAAGGVDMRDLKRLVLEAFGKPAVVGWYALCMVVLGLHLHHAVASALETFGVDHPRWTPLILKGSKGLAWAIALGFGSIPVLVLAGRVTP